jgi:hypothetical protein
MWMDEGKREHDWSQTSWILALLYNPYRPERQPAKTPNDFNPTAAAKKKQAKKMTPRDSVLHLGDFFGIPRPKDKA